MALQDTSSELSRLLRTMQQLRDADKAKLLSGFFKTGKGQYGEGDVFLGLTVPQQRVLAKQYERLTLSEIQRLLDSPVHEHRLTGLIILVRQFERGSDADRRAIYEFYVENTNRINNWDLVDVTSPNIVGTYLLDKKRDVLYTMARSKNLWDNRIAIVSTFAFIRHNQFDDTLKIAEVFMHHKHDLMHKATGWMLREVGKRDIQALECFLNKHAKHMPRTMLRYAIEKMTSEKKHYYMGCKH